MFLYNRIKRDPKLFCKDDWKNNPQAELREYVQILVDSIDSIN